MRRRGSGYYIDVGASDLIGDGHIKLKAGVQVAVLTERSVVLADGSELAADLVVYATGYGSMSNWAAALISRRSLNVGPCWDSAPDRWRSRALGGRAALRKPTAQDGLWFHGGNLAQSRHYSRYLALS